MKAQRDNYIEKDKREGFMAGIRITAILDELSMRLLIAIAPRNNIAILKVVM
ncbi:MAG: hypothetical protein IT392_12975 [Nitrospirae bacterium]|nr:hypothetical protein [Nitrospirota bacterium]